MTTNGRNFLRNALFGTSILSTGFLGYAALLGNSPIERQKFRNVNQHFNMCGYSAPKMDKVRIGFIGLVRRGLPAVERMSFIEEAEIIGLCDIESDKVAKCQKIMVDWLSHFKNLSRNYFFDDS